MHRGNSASPLFALKRYKSDLITEVAFFVATVFATQSAEGENPKGATYANCVCVAPKGQAPLENPEGAKTVCAYGAGVKGMDFYHVHFGVCSRSNGQNAIAMAAYAGRTGESKNWKTANRRVQAVPWRRVR